MEVNGEPTDQVNILRIVRGVPAWSKGRYPSERSRIKQDTPTTP